MNSGGGTSRKTHILFLLQMVDFGQQRSGILMRLDCLIISEFKNYQNILVEIPSSLAGLAIGK